MNKDTELIFENYFKKIHNNDLESLLEADLVEFEKFLIKEGLFDKFKQKAAAAGKGVKDFATKKLLQPIINKAIQFLSKNDPETLKKLQAAQGDKAAMDAILAQGKQEQQKIQQGISTTNESNEYYTNQFFLASWNSTNGWLHAENLPLNENEEAKIALDENGTLYLIGKCNYNTYLNLQSYSSGGCIGRILLKKQ